MKTSKRPLPLIYFRRVVNDHLYSKNAGAGFIGRAHFHTTRRLFDTFIQSSNKPGYSRVEELKYQRKLGLDFRWCLHGNSNHNR